MRHEKSLCLWHEEKTPSLWVNHEKGFYHCFGCGKHGPIDELVQKKREMMWETMRNWLEQEQ